jgi:uncharacterized protein (DUF433 family)
MIDTKESVMVVRATQGLIQKNPGRMGGSACVRNSRIAVWNLVAYRRLGATDEKLLEMYPGLSANDLAAAWAYFDSHPAEIEQDLRENEDSSGAT